MYENFEMSPGPIRTLPGQREWIALYTRSRHEKTVDLELQRKGIESFLPLRLVTRVWSDRKKEVLEPVFKSYVFARVNSEERVRALMVQGAVRCVTAEQGVAATIPAEQIEALKKFVEYELKLDPYPYLHVGRRVRVRCGPLKGIEGIIVRKNKQCRLVISIEFMMQSVSVEVDEALLEVV